MIATVNIADLGARGTLRSLWQIARGNARSSIGRGGSAEPSTCGKSAVQLNRRGAADAHRSA